MQIEMGINANCSEATIYIDLKNQDKRKVRELVKKLEFEMTYHGPEDEDWDIDEPHEFELSEGSVEYDKIFGREILRISGDAPFNYPDELEKVIRRYLPKAKMEYKEP
jgi:hypothetical protein